ncbi:MAG TPA: gamma-glutamyltransferase family protein [Solirubrobacteraceae bacterium]|jgi:gamma-glutamyltranspeptidase/glutathione hydrolase
MSVSRRLLASLTATIALLAAGAAAADAARVPAAHPTATGSGGSVASMDGSASRAGIDVLRHGGNAVDAAVATASALGVTVPFVAGPGGGGFMVIYNARTHTVTTIDGRETCPQSCTKSLFLDPKTHKPMDYVTASDQPLSTGVPSMVATWSLAVKRFGRESLKADLSPAASIARRGFAVNRDFRQLTRSGLPLIRAYPASRHLFLTPKGNPLPLGHVLRNPGLAHTYAEIGAHGARYLYDGPLGQAIVKAVDTPTLTPGQKVITTPGKMTMADLQAYRARVQPPTHVTYDGLSVYGMAPPSSSGTTVGEALNILSGFPLSTEPRAQALYQYIEASRLAYADRDRYLGDPRFSKVPVAKLLSPSFAAARGCLITGKALTSPLAPGNPFKRFTSCKAAPRASVQATSASPEAHHTNNIVATDRWGDIVAYTNTINFFGGSGEVVPGYGFFLNDELTDFDFAPESNPTSHPQHLPDPNLPGPGKQPRSSMGPLIALSHGKPLLAIGAAGGSTIPETILQTFIGHVDFGMSLEQALAAPRIAQTNSPTTLAEPRFYRSAMRHTLQQRYGEKFSLATGSILPLDNYPGDATAVQILRGGRVQSIAEPYRLFGGSAFVVHPGR